MVVSITIELGSCFCQIWEQEIIEIVTLDIFGVVQWAQDRLCWNLEKMEEQTLIMNEEEVIWGKQRKDKKLS